jgi:hypothetical protein
VTLTFSAAYTGTLRLYAVDLSALGRREIITVNGQAADLSSDFSQGAWVSFPLNAATTVTITVDRTAGYNAVLSGIFLGDAGPPPAFPVAPQGSWVGTYGSAGYVLAGWTGSGDLSNLPNGSASLDQGSRYVWSAGTSDVRALQSPDGLSRSATDGNQVRVTLTFSPAYSGTLRLYAVDFSALGRREIITVNGQAADLASDFSQGAWVSFPINNAATVTITIDRTAGYNAVLSGIFLN